ANALEKLEIDFEVLEYSQHARTAGDDAEAACYIGADVNGMKMWGVGIAGSTTRASLSAMTSAVNRALSENPRAIAHSTIRLRQRRIRCAAAPHPWNMKFSAVMGWPNSMMF